MGPPICYPFIPYIPPPYMPPMPPYIPPPYMPPPNPPPIIPGLPNPLEYGLLLDPKAEDVGTDDAEVEGSASEIKDDDGPAPPGSA